MHVLLAHKTGIIDQNTGKFQVSRAGKYLFKPSVCGDARARIAIKPSRAKIWFVNFECTYFLMHVLLAHKLVSLTKIQASFKFSHRQIFISTNRLRWRPCSHCHKPSIAIIWFVDFECTYFFNTCFACLLTKLILLTKIQAGLKCRA